MHRSVHDGSACLLKLRHKFKTTMVQSCVATATSASPEIWIRWQKATCLTRCIWPVVKPARNKCLPVSTSDLFSLAAQSFQTFIEVLVAIATGNKSLPILDSCDSRCRHRSNGRMTFLLHLVDHTSQESREVSPPTEYVCYTVCRPRHKRVAELLPLVAALLNQTPFVVIDTNGTRNTAPVESATTSSQLPQWIKRALAEVSQAR